MLILLAEAKTMQTAESAVSAIEYGSHKPLYESVADELMSRLASMSVGELTHLLKVSGSLALKMFQFAYNFPDKNNGLECMLAYTGVVFKALDFPSLNPEERHRCNSGVRIVSSLYGWLRPDDIVKPYRLDYSSELPVGNNDFIVASSFWRKDVTVALVNTIRRDGHSEILNLLPGDAAKCIDWKLVKNFAKVWKVDFTDAVTEKTPQAGKLKTMRGKLVRQILKDNIGSAEDLKTVVSDGYVCEGTPRYPDHLHFLC